MYLIEEFESSPGDFADVAQLAERFTCNEDVGGSSPFIGSYYQSFCKIPLSCENQADLIHRIAGPFLLVDIAQLVERQVVVLNVMSSSLIIHPPFGIRN